MGGLKVGRLFAELHLDRKGFETGLAAAGRSITGFGTVVAKGLAVAGAALLAGAGATAKFAADFQTNMANVQTLVGKGSEADARIAELGQAVKGMSMATGKSLDDLSQGLYDVIGTFGDTADAAGWLEIAAKAGTAGMSTTQEAIGLLAAVTKSYGDTSLEAAQKAADLAFQTANLGVTTFPEMAASMGKVLPLASTLKVSQEELFGAMATLTGVTGNTGDVVTQLAGIMTAFIKPNNNMKAAIKEMGFESGEAAIQSLGLGGSLKALKGTTTVAEKGLAKVLGRSEPLIATLALTGAQAKDFAEKTAAMGDAAGATASAFEIQQQTVNAAMARVQQSIGVVLVTIGEKFLPVLQDLLDWVLDNWDSIAAVIDEALFAIGDAITWAVDNVFPLLGQAFQFIAEEVMPVLAAAFQVIVEDVIPALVSAFGSVSEGAGPMIGDAFNFIANDVIPFLVQAITWVSEEVIPKLVAVFSAVVKWVADNWPTISSVFGQVAGAIGSIIGTVWNVVQPVATVLFPIVSAAATVLLNVLDVAFKAIGGVFEVFGAVAEAVFDAVTGIWSGIAGFFSENLGGVGDAFKSGINFIIDMVNGFIGFLNNLKLDIPRVKVGPIDVGGGSIDPFNISLIPHLAKGARNFAGGIALVGEQGPELVNLPRGADVMTAGQTRSALGGDGQVTVTIRDPDRAIRDGGYNQADIERFLSDALSALVGGVKHRSLRMGTTG